MIMRIYTTVILALIILCFSTNTYLSHAADTISPNQTLSGDQTIISSGGGFELGFFTTGKSSKHYIGIWYKKTTEKTVIWVANRETPISDKHSAHLKISQGNLVLVNESQIEIWSTGLNTTDSSSSVSAVLLDDGNLVLRQGLGSNSSSPAQNLWESYNNPSHTWMPGARIGYNKITKKKQFLTSWKNSEDPAPGLFTLEPDQDNSQYVIRRNNSEQYWASGPWDGELFSAVPEMRTARKNGYEFTYVDNENETSYTYTIRDPSIITRQILDVSGQVKQLIWMGDNWNVYWSKPMQCEVRAYCGEFGVCKEPSFPFCSCLEGFKHRFEDEWELNDFSGGCVREDALECGNADRRKDKFMMSSGMGLPQYSRLLSVESRGECESTCSSACSCTAYAYDEGGCSLWDGGLLNLQRVSEGNSSGRSIYIRLSAYSTVFRGQKNDKGVVIGAAVGSSVVVVVMLAVVAALWRRWRRSGTNKVEGSLVAFKYKDLKNATKNFSDKLGGGGFGSVYRGTLPDSTVMAVKKLEGANQGEKQFRAEVSTIGTIQHVNLVRLLGFCREGKKQLLVYEYLKNGSLDSHLFKAEESMVLEWRMRYQIALGIARGLVYLHEKCRDCIIHCDIKPENILLDADFCPKVGDFGLAKLVGRDFSRVLTTMRGTRGYLAPEWLSGVAITTKADVYSYGMLLFELVSGRRNTELSADDNANFFPSLAASVTVNGGDIPGLLDPLLNRRADEEELSTLCKVACWCVQDDENRRPSMSRVVQILEGVVGVSSPPIPQGLRVVLAARQEHIVFFNDSSASSVPSSPSKTNS
ncbi:G-type lectin S-receptor-like serine/threonine-protein kinase At2g19130 [Salvia miltiorrhiza]|uniref:G-type lectin S-receptor-like serine/threonine-protein kinase At2g19130 n=1 Tax=Salvia miltiorrhiza TaxID=226208 RepID=UPI0025AD46F4|nr:G-type lectin S-receptor-like serine/threonine-protein kinase At2g19130 [Salvia miltiorrhiza]